MNRLACFLAVGALALGFSTSSSHAATTKWVDQAGGSDLNDGNTEAMAYATLQFAIDASMSGDGGTQSVINVKDGAYGATSAGTNPCFTFAPAAIIVQNLDFLTIQAAPGQDPEIMPGVGDIVSLAIDNSDHVIIDNIDSDQSTAEFDHWHVCNSEDLTVRNSTFEGANAEDGIDFETSHATAVIEHNTFRDMIEDTLDFSDGAYSDISIQDNVFEPNQRRPILIRKFSTDVITGFTIRRNMFLGTNDQEAIRLIGADDITVVNNVIMNSRQQGLYIDSGSTNITVLHNSFFNNDQEGGPNGELRTKVTSADIVIKNNIFYANGSNPIFETGAASLPSEDFNLVFNSPQIGGAFTFGTSTITGDPLFVSTTPGSEDLNLTIGSPAINVATDLGVADDITKADRPVGTDPDMGAYEFGAGASVTFLLLDEEAIDEDTPAIEALADLLGVDADDLVNEDIADVGVRTPLPIPVGTTLTLPTGEVGDEGWFALKTIPDSWDAAGPDDGLRNFVNGSGFAGDEAEVLLEEVPDVTPLRSAGLGLLVDTTVCALVFEDDIDIDFDPLVGDLSEENLGLIAFTVMAVGASAGGDLPPVDIVVEDTADICAGALELFADAPEIVSSPDDDDDDDDDDSDDDDDDDDD